MPEFPKKGYKYYVHKLPNGKWSVREERTDGTKQLLGEYEDRATAEKHASDLSYTVMAFEGGEELEEWIRTGKTLEKGAPNRERKKEENFARQEALDIHNERLAQRRQEFEAAQARLTRHQQRRNERSP